MNTRCVLLAMGIVLGFSRSAFGQFITLEGRKFMLNGAEFYPRAMNVAVDLASNSSDGSTGIYWALGHNYGAPPDGNLECSDPVSCHDQLLAAFEKVASMGFNTVRLVAVGPEMRGTSGGQFYLNIRENTTGWDPWPPFTLLFEESADFHGPVSDGHFDRLRGLLDIAVEADLKVILLSMGAPKGSGWSAGWDWSAVHRATGYLRRLGEELRDHPALLAYDLWNEPHWQQAGFRQWSKTDVCQITTEWYNALRENNDPNHLVTLGNSAPEDIYAWEPNVMKLDFISIHVYPDQYQPDGYDFENKLDRVKAKIYWYSEACPMPYIIGETAFSAESETDDHSSLNHLDAIPAHHAPPWMDGNEQQQQAYAQETMNATREYLGSGYSWWEFQNSDAGGLDDPAPPEAPYGPPPGYLGKFYGPLKYGDANALGGPEPWYDKPVVGTFINHQLAPTPVNSPPPPDFYEWGAFNGSHGSGTLLRTIALQDQNAQPIPRALGWEKMHYYSNNSGNPVFQIENWLVSSSDGQLLIRDGPVYENEQAVTRELKIHVPGGKSHPYGSIYHPSSNLILHREDLVFRRVVSDLMIPSGEMQELKAWSVLLCDNVVFSGEAPLGATGILRARDIVELRSGFHAQLGSDVHVFNEAVWPECGPEMNTFSLPEGSEAQETLKSVDERVTLDLVFSKPLVSITSVQPNPFTDHVVLNSNEPDGGFSLRSSNGSLLLKGRLAGTMTDLDLTGLPSGAYCITFHLVNAEQTHWISKIH